MDRIGDRMKKIRMRQDRTLEEIARASGLTRSMISKVENGKAAPAVGTLMRIAAALGVQGSTLLEESSSEAPVFQKSVLKEIPVNTERGFSFSPIASMRADKLMHPSLVRARKGEVKRHKLSHAGEEFIYILEGVIRAKVGENEFIMSAGDTLYFNTEESHSLMPMTEEAVYISVACGGK